ncbi:hypothetical protein BC828DRAFT_373206 [Blastocladiella britannica]|nr:hypothetical protein BC828DRAFT_373206 [Blastocladiella britannica]
MASHPSAAVVGAGVPDPSECTALLQLYQATAGQHWASSKGFATAVPGATDCCTGAWYGVTCDADNHVAKLDLRSNNLLGTLPAAALAKLPWLRYLNINNNKLSGSLAPVAQLTVLREFSLRYNQFSGQLPAELGSLPNLEFLSASDNQFTSVHPNLANATSLQVLYLGHNSLKDIPAAVTAMNLTVLHLNAENYTAVPASLAKFRGEKCSIAAPTTADPVSNIGPQSLCLPPGFPANSPCLQMYYDDSTDTWSNATIQLQPCNAQGGGGAPPVFVPHATTFSGRPLSTWALLAAVTGGLIVAGLIFGALWWLRSRRKGRKLERIAEEGLRSRRGFFGGNGGGRSRGLDGGSAAVVPNQSGGALSTDPNPHPLQQGQQQQDWSPFGPEMQQDQQQKGGANLGRSVSASAASRPRAGAFRPFVSTNPVGASPALNARGLVTGRGSTAAGAPAGTAVGAARPAVRVVRVHRAAALTAPEDMVLHLPSPQIALATAPTSRTLGPIPWDSPAVHAAAAAATSDIPGAAEPDVALPLPSLVVTDHSSDNGDNDDDDAMAARLRPPALRVIPATPGADDAAESPLGMDFDGASAGSGGLSRSNTAPAALMMAKFSGRFRPPSPPGLDLDMSVGDDEGALEQQPPPPPELRFVSPSTLLGT